MVCLYLQCKRLKKVEKMGWKRIHFESLAKTIRNVEDHVEDCFNKIKASLSTVNLPHLGYNIKNRATFQELPEKSPISGKRKKKLLLEIEKKESRNTKRFPKTTRVDESEPLVQSEQTEQGQCE